LRHPVIKAVGHVLVALILAGLVVTVVTAAWSGQLFYGVNYKGLDLGTYSTLAAIVMALLIGVVWVMQRALRVLRRERSSTSKVR
jgi:hypothetical protein